jgi:murein DD-endopeptidase MepM/ murein hydrolase activator NlpD
MIRHQRFKPIAAVIAAISALGAVTAVAFAPLTATDRPSILTIREDVLLSVAGEESLDRFMQVERVRRGDSLGSLLGRIGAIDADFQRFVAAHPIARRILQLKPGRTVLAELDGAGRIQSFSYRINGLEETDIAPVKTGRRITISRDDSRFVFREEEAPVERSIEMRSAVVRTSLFAAIDQAGIPDTVAVQLEEVFGSEMDISRSLKRGDALRVIYETLREAGSFDTPVAGRVLAVDMVSDGEHHEAIRFDRAPSETRAGARSPKAEYYTFDGRGLKKSFLRNPLEFSRVMSGFTESRLNPITREWRAHRGVDFAAPIGTRVRSVADGTIEFSGLQRGYGNVLIIRHGGSLSTLYAHLSDFADGLHEGSKVNEGDVIGYVGQTGWATGPHLHYEFRINGEQTDPLTVALPQSRPLDDSERKRFLELAEAFRSKLARFDEFQIARFQ